MANRFEQVDEPQEDAITLTIEQRSDGRWGHVFCPATAVQGRLPKDYRSEDLPPVDALKAAVELANQLQVAIVVVDRDAIWQPAWGELYRWEEEADASDGPGTGSSET
jgi:pheromone shutdown protein TraB